MSPAALWYKDLPDCCVWLSVNFLNAECCCHPRPACQSQSDAGGRHLTCLPLRRGVLGSAAAPSTAQSQACDQIVSTREDPWQPSLCCLGFDRPLGGTSEESSVEEALPLVFSSLGQAWGAAHQRTLQRSDSHVHIESIFRDKRHQ